MGLLNQGSEYSILSPGNILGEVVVSVPYMAPETLNEKVAYGRVVDWWALGVLIYEMLVGTIPFDSDDEDKKTGFQRLKASIRRDAFEYPASITGSARSLLQGLLEKDPASRLGGGEGDADEIKRHPFFEGIEWDLLLAKKVEPPFRPEVDSDTDTRYFEPKDTTLSLPALLDRRPRKGEANFDRFSYYGSPSVTSQGAHSRRQMNSDSATNGGLT